jgi:hypothetical protein
MSIHEDPNEFLESSGIPSAKFPEIGTVVRGTVLSAAVSQQRDFDTNEPKFYDDGNPMKQLVVTLATDERDPEVDGDDGTRRLFVKGQMLTVVRAALRKASAKIEPGGTLVVKFADEGTAPRKGANKPKIYEAAYKAGNKPEVDELLADDTPAEAAPAPVVAQPSAADLLDA